VTAERLLDRQQREPVLLDRALELVDRGAAVVELAEQLEPRLAGLPFDPV
jgi:hypothetical protein